MMRKKILSVIAISLFFLWIVPSPSYAQEQILQFRSSVVAHENGEMTVTETIVYDFGNQDRHGIFRFIPLVSSVGELYRVIDIEFMAVQRNGETEQYETDYSRDQVEVKIGDPDTLISGEQTYTIMYVVSNGIGSNYENHDEIYWNVTGSSWSVPIISASVTLITDTGVPVGEMVCFTGSDGSTEKNCEVFDQGIGKTVVTIDSLSPSEGLTVVALFPVNTFPKSTLQENRPMDPDVKMFLYITIPLLVFLNFILAPLLVWWYFKKKHKKHFGPPTVNFEIPKDGSGERISPAEAGTIDSTKLDKDDITATIFDLAIRKYIRIESLGKKKNMEGLGRKEVFQLIKVKDFSQLSEFEKILLHALFEGRDKAMLSDAKLSYNDFKRLEKANFKSLIARGLYTKNPSVQMGALLGLGIVSLFTINLVLGPVLIFLSRMLNGRTKLGDETDWKIDGLKIFLKATKRYNEWQAKNILTIEQMIPYAMSLGSIDQFMKQLKILKPDFQPSWYTGRGNIYGSYALFSSSVGSSVTTSASSSSSGFSGGSVGGGGGGGGGGSW